MGKELTDEEYQQLEEKAEKAEALEEEKQKLLEEQESLAKEKKELEAQVNPNFKALREVNKRLSSALKAQGKEVDEEGNIIEEKQVSIDDVRIAAREEARKEAISIRRDELLSGIEDEEERKLTEHYLDKLTAGEEVDLKNIRSYFESAVKAAVPTGGNRVMDIIANSNGQPPRRVEKRTSELSDEVAEDIASSMGIKIK